MVLADWIENDPVVIAVWILSIIVAVAVILCLKWILLAREHLTGRAFWSDLLRRWRI